MFQPLISGSGPLATSPRPSVTQGLSQNHFVNIEKDTFITLITLKNSKILRSSVPEIGMKTKYMFFLLSIIHYIYYLLFHWMSLDGKCFQMTGRGSSTVTLA